MRGDPIKVLLVEDNAADAVLIVKMLEKANNSTFEIEKADCLQKALERLEQKKYDAVLSDIGLPDSNGKETFLSINEKAQDAPIVLLTGIDDESFAVQLIKEGAQDYLVKGKINLDLLERAIHYAIERGRLLQKIRSMTLVDELTGLYNLRGFKTLAEKQIKLAERLGMGMLLYFIDIDGLKRINDTYGHDEGSFAIVKTANILMQTFRESDIIARFGGDEFVVLLLEKAGLKAEILDSRLKDNLDAFNSMSNAKYDLAITSGLARYDAKNPVSMDQLMKQADSIMYKGKKAKKRS